MFDPLDDADRSEQWLTLVEQIGEVESLRLKTEESLILTRFVMCQEIADYVAVQMQRKHVMN